MAEIGHTGLKTWGGQITEEFIRELRGIDGYRRYNEMRWNCAPIGALLNAFEYSLRGVDWYFESDEGEDDPRLELLDAALEGLESPIEDHLSEALTMLPYGWALFEQVYKRDGNRVLWDKLSIRSQDTLYKWEFDKAGKLTAFWQVNPETYQPLKIPAEKFVLYRTRAEKNNPEGRSILRNAWTSYYYWKNLSQIEAIGIERDVAGLPMIILPPGATTNTSDATSDASVADKFVRNIRNDEQAGLVIPNGWQFQLLSSAGAKQMDVDKVIRRYESRILMSCLAQFLILGQDNVGTQALSSDMTDFFSMALNSIADLFADTFTRYNVRRLLALNGMDDTGIRLTHSIVGDTNMGDVAAFLQSAGSYLTWTPTDEKWLRATARMPELTEDAIPEEEEPEPIPVEMPEQIEGGEEEPEDIEEQEEGEYSAKPYANRREQDIWERRLLTTWRGYLKGQQKRVIAGARSLRNGKV